MSDNAPSYAPEVQTQMLEALKMAYRKHHVEDERIGWDELSDVLCDALCNAMGNREYIEWSRDIIADIGYRGATDFA